MMARTGGRPPARIAVVGNAPLGTSRERAVAIDGADLVVRMTTFAVDADESVVGTRTDVVVLHRATVPGPATFQDIRSRLYLLAEPGRTFWEEERRPPWWPGDLELVPISNREFTAGTRAALGLRRSAIAWPTTGTLAVHLMHRLFPHARILLTGTSLGDGRQRRRTAFEHRWGPAVTVTPEHRPAREAAAIAAWRLAGWLEVAR